MWEFFEREAPITAREIIGLALLRDRRGWGLGLATAGLMVHQVCEAAVPILIGVIVDSAVVPRDARALWWWLAALGAVFVVLSASYQWASLRMVGVYGHAEHDLRQLVIRRILHPLGGQTRHEPGTALSVASSDTYRVAGVSWSIATQGATLAALLTSTVALLLISVPLGLGVLFGAAGVLLGMQALAKPLERLGMTEQASVAAASNIATDTMQGLRIVRGLGAEAELSRRYRAASRESLRGAVVAARRLITYGAVSDVVSVLYLAVLALAAAWMALAGQITPGQLITVVALAQFLQGSLAHIGTFGANWAHKRASTRRVQSFISEPFTFPLLPGAAGVAETAGTAETAEVAGTVLDARAAAGRGTDMGAAASAGAAVNADAATETGAGAKPTAPAASTPAPPPLSVTSLSLQLRPNELTGVRVHGAVQARELAARLGLRRAPDRQELLVGGLDVLDVGPEAYRRAIGAPPHDATIFTGSLWENVTVYGRTDLDPRLVTAAGLDDVIAHLGSASVNIGEAGRRLSGGQRQRVLLARALHAGTDVVILDEPTTALDPLTEERVAAGLRALGRTIVVITSSPLLLAHCQVVIDARGIDPRRSAAETTAAARPDADRPDANEPDANEPEPASESASASAPKSLPHPTSPARPQP